MIIWLSSYPKSGNTWVRSIISSLLFTNDGEHTFDNMYQIDQYPSRKYFNGLITDFQDVNQLKKNWILSQDKINFNRKNKILKTHHLNCKINEYEFTNLANTLGVIYVVRDPRNIVTSIKHHYSLNDYSHAKRMLFNKQTAIGIGVKDNKENNIPTLIGSWSEHYNSWKNTKKNYLLIKYEDLLNNTENELKNISEYLKKFFNFNLDNRKIDRILKTTSFDHLKSMENKGLFLENVTNGKNQDKKQFFNLGSKNNWKKLLDKNTTNEIQEQFNNEMKELGYID